MTRGYTAKDAVAKGLFLDITTTGVKSWWYRYSLNGKQERLVIGRYPDLSLKYKMSDEIHQAFV